MPLSVNVSTGLVKGRFGSGVKAGPNGEKLLIPARGRIDFEPVAPYVPYPTGTPAAFTILRRVTTAILDSEGYLCTPHPDYPDVPGVRGLELYSPDDPQAGVQGWTWKGTPRFVNADGTRLHNTMEPFTFDLPYGEEVDLVNVVDMPASPGIGKEQAIILAAAAQAAATSAAGSAEAAAEAARAVVGALPSKADLIDGKVPVDQLPPAVGVTDEVVAPLMDMPETAAKIDARVAEQVAGKLDAGTAEATFQTKTDAAGLATRLGDATTAEGKALARGVAATGVPAARDGHAYQFIAGVIRNDGDGWKLIRDAAHRPINIDSVETISDSSGGYIRLNYPSFGPNMVATVIAAPDETFAGAGFTVGTSVSATYTDIKIGAPDQQSDYVFYDGSKWVSNKGVFSDITFSGGKITLKHKTISQGAIHAVNVTPRGPRFNYAVSNDGSSFLADTLRIEARDNSPEYADSVFYDGTNWVSQSGVFTNMTFNNGTLTITHPSVYTDQWWRISVTGRGQYDARLARAGTPTNGTTVKVEWVDATGNIVTTPTVGMQALVIKGGGQRQLASAPHADMKFFVSHGQGSRHVDPATITTTTYPSSNIWIYGVVGIPDAA